MRTVSWAVKSKLLIGIFAYSITLMSSPYVHAFSGSGAGTISDPYEITNCTELQNVRNNLSAHYELVNSINCAAVSASPGFSPISGNSEFTGTFDGNGYTIDSLSIDPPGNPNSVSLFGNTQGAAITNLALHNLTVVGGENVGGLAGSSTDTDIRQIRLQNALIVGTKNVGGIIGYVTSYGSALINSSTRNTTVKGSDAFSETTNIGGAVGHAGSEGLKYISTHGSVIGNDKDISRSRFVGGIVGSAETHIQASYSSANVSGGEYVGGITGKNEHIFSFSYSSGSVEGDAYVGGISGVGSWAAAIFSSALVAGNASTTGGLYGEFNQASSFINMWFSPPMIDLSRTSQTACLGSSSNDLNEDIWWVIYEPTCQTASEPTIDSNYFFNTTDRPLFDAHPLWDFDVFWDFENIWKVQETDFPIHRTAPNKPMNIQTMGGPASVTVSWDPPASDDQAPITGYLLEYAEAGKSAMTKVSNIDPADDTYTITGLKPSTEYNLRLRAVNDRGTGSLENLTAQTEPGQPTNPPGTKPPVTNFSSTTSHHKVSRTNASHPHPSESNLSSTNHADDTGASTNTHNNTHNNSANENLNSDTSPHDLESANPASKASWWWLLSLPILIGMAWAWKVRKHADKA